MMMRTFAAFVGSVRWATNDVMPLEDVTFLGSSKDERWGGLVDVGMFLWWEWGELGCAQG